MHEEFEPLASTAMRMWCERAIYTTVKNPAGSLIGGWHVYRNDPDESFTHILAQGLTEAEARACVEALNKLARKRTK